MTAFAERRTHQRFEITGELWASLDVTAEVTLCDISTGGGLIELPGARVWSALSTITLTLGPGSPSVTGVVTRISPSPSDPTRRLAAMQFVQVSSDARAALEELVKQLSV